MTEFAGFKGFRWFSGRRFLGLGAFGLERLRAWGGAQRLRAVGFQGLGFRVQGLGFQGFRVSGFSGLGGDQGSGLLELWVSWLFGATPAQGFGLLEPTTPELEEALHPSALRERILTRTKNLRNCRLETLRSLSL